MSPTDQPPQPPSPSKVHLPDVAGDGGVVWSVSPGGLHVNLVVLAPGGAIAEHRNDEVDVVLVVLAGGGEASIDDVRHDLRSGDAITIPVGARRSTTAGPDGLRYLTIHAERAPLSIAGRSKQKP